MLAEKIEMRKSCTHCGSRQSVNGRLCKRCRKDETAVRRKGAIARIEADEPTEDELDAMIAEGYKNLPSSQTRVAKDHQGPQGSVQGNRELGVVLMTQRYLVAKYAPDVFRMEPRNIGVILWADGNICAKFLDDAKADFISDKEVYLRWLSYWNRLINERTISNGRVISADDPAFLDALLKKQEGNYLLLDAGRVIDDIGAEGIHNAADFLFNELVAPIPESQQAADDNLTEVTETIFDEIGIKERADWKGSRRGGIIRWRTEIEDQMDKIYIVSGTTGEYSDRSDWEVAAYYDKDQADLHAAKANEHAYKARDYGAKMENPFDPNMEGDPFTGTKYAVSEMKLFRHIDEFLENI